MKISISDAISIRCDFHGEYKLMAIEELDEHRWYREELVVFMVPGYEQHWGFFYMKPLTEMQWGQDVVNVDSDGFVECKRVYRKQVVTTTWEVAPDLK